MSEGPPVDPLIGPVARLRTRGRAQREGRGRGNVYAVLREGFSVLIDADRTSVSALQPLAEAGHPVEAVLTLSAGGEDAATDDLPGLPKLRFDGEGWTGSAFRNTAASGSEMEHPLLERAGLHTVLVPVDDQMGVMLHLRDEGGIVLTGDCATGPRRGPMTSNGLGRPEVSDMLAFAEAWQGFLSERPVSAVLPRTGQPILRREMGEDDFAEALRLLWEGIEVDMEGEFPPAASR